jgi:hypothetical protein
MDKHAAMLPLQILDDSHGFHIAGLLHVNAKVKGVAEILGVGQGREKALEGTRPIIGYDTDVDSRCVPICRKRI